MNFPGSNRGIKVVVIIQVKNEESLGWAPEVSNSGCTVESPGEVIKNTNSRAQHKLINLESLEWGLDTGMF